MNILVCISHVPDTTSKINFTDGDTKFDTNGVQYVINPLDEFALLPGHLHSMLAEQRGKQLGGIERLQQIVCGGGQKTGFGGIGGLRVGLGRRGALEQLLAGGAGFGRFGHHLGHRRFGFRFRFFRCSHGLRCCGRFLLFDLLIEM